MLRHARNALLLLLLLMLCTPPTCVKRPLVSPVLVLKYCRPGTDGLSCVVDSAVGQAICTCTTRNADGTHMPTAALMALRVSSPLMQMRVGTTTAAHISWQGGVRWEPQPEDGFTWCYPTQ